jgi:hypothetical protein
MTDSETNDLVRTLNAHLEATEELAIRTEANRWLGEAHAIATDLTDAQLASQTVEKRVGHIEELLSQIEETDNSEADEHIQASLEAAKKIKKRL